MSTYSLTEAKNQLSDLIERALDGEAIVITRYGRPVVELRPIPRPPHPVSAAALDWLAKRRVGRRARTSAGKLVSKVRDDEER